MDLNFVHCPGNSVGSRRDRQVKANCPLTCSIHYLGSAAESRRESEAAGERECGGGAWKISSRG